MHAVCYITGIQPEVHTCYVLRTTHQQVLLTHALCQLLVFHGK